MKMKAYASFDLYQRDQTPRHQAIIRALRKFVKGKAPVAYVFSAADYVQFGFFRGSALKDPKGLLNGEGKYVRHIKVFKRSEIEERAFGALLRQAAK